MKKKGKKKIILPRFAFALTPIYSLRVLSPFAQYNLVEFPNTDQYNVYYVPSNNSERKKNKSNQYDDHRSIKHVPAYSLLIAYIPKEYHRLYFQYLIW